MTDGKDKSLKGKNGKYKARQFAEVTTSIDLIDRQIELLPKIVISDLSKTFFDPCTGDGRYLMRILYHRLPYINNDDELLKVISSLYGIELQKENVLMARGNLLECVRSISQTVDLTIAEQIILNNIKQGNFLESELL